MIKKVKVLVIDKHPIFLDYFENVLQLLSNKHNFEFDVKFANNCDSANLELEHYLKNNFLDLVILDTDLPSSKCQNYRSGIDICLKIRKEHKNAKIMICTSYDDNYQLNAILKNINPDGLLLKEDIIYKDLINGLEAILIDPPFYSKKVIRLLRQKIANNFVLDSLDTKLLYELSQGTKNKDLPKILPLSMAGIERRKRKLKSLFKPKTNEDLLLVKMAKLKGFI